MGLRHYSSKIFRLTENRTKFKKNTKLTRETLQDKEKIEIVYKIGLQTSELYPVSSNWMHITKIKNLEKVQEILHMWILRLKRLHTACQNIFT